MENEKINKNELIEDLNMAIEGAYAERPLRDTARSESLKISPEEKAVLDNVANRVGEMATKDRGGQERVNMVKTKKFEAKKYDVLPEEEVFEKARVGSKIKIMGGAYSGMKGEFYKVGEPGKFYAGEPVVRITFGPPELMGTDVLPKSIDYLIPIERFAHPKDLKPGSRIKSGRNEKGTITNEISEEYPDETVIVQMDNGKKWEASSTAEVEILSNPALSLNR